MSYTAKCEIVWQQQDRCMLCMRQLSTNSQQCIVIMHVSVLMQNK